MGRPRKNAFDEETTVRVLRAAEEVFGERGFKEARLEDIATLAGIRRSSLLYHFKSKDNLYQQVVDKAFSEVASAMARGLEGGTRYADQLDATITELLAFQEQHAGLMAVVLRALLNPAMPGHAEIGAKFSLLIDQLERFILDAGGSLDGRPVRAIVMQLVITHLAHAAMGETADRVWGDGTHTREIARMLLVPGVEQST